jgi:two-component system alkaline phosphatase synthesis response regulator PhoP
MKVLLVDDEPDIIEFLSYNLKKEGFEVLSAGNGIDAITVAKKELPDIIILDIMMPVLDGVSTCRKMREMPSLKNKIILFLTARGEEYSEVAGFDAGADDYITKPVKIRVLIARINSLKNRLSKGKFTEDGQDVELGEFRISNDERMVYKSGQRIQLPKKEFEILMLLSSKPGKIFTREQIYNTLWGSDSIVSERTLDVHIRKLRENIGEEFIKTSKGVGYAFVFDVIE